MAAISFHSIFLHPLMGALKLSLKLVIIIVPLLVVYEGVRALPWWRRFENLAGKTGKLRGSGFSVHTLTPLLTGIFLGIAYGAGVIIKISREKALESVDLWFMGLFLATCHAVVEDTLIFVIVGGMGRWIIIPRFLLAITLTGALFWIVSRKKTKQISSQTK